MKKLFLTLVLCLSSLAYGATYDSTVFEASRIIKGGPGGLSHLTITNSSASLQYILIFNSANLPADGAFANLAYPPIPVSAQTIIDIPFTPALALTAGLVICNSTTLTTKTIGAADCWFHAIFN